MSMVNFEEVSSVQMSGHKRHAKCPFSYLVGATQVFALL